MRKSTTDRSTWSSPNPIEPVLISRCAIYAPVTRIAHNSTRASGMKRSSETPWGRADLSGPILTWEHRRITLLAKLRAKETRVWEDGSLSVWIDAYEVKKELGYDNGGEDHRRFLQRLRDLKTANLVTLNHKTGKITESSIVWSFSYDKEKLDDLVKPGVLMSSKGSALFEIRFSKEYMELFADDMRIHCDPLISDLVQIKDGMIASVVMFFLTMQSACRYKIREVLEIIGATYHCLDKGTISKLIKRVRNAKDFERFGVTVEGDCLVYNRSDKVFFTNPSTSKKPALAGKLHQNPRKNQKVAPESPESCTRIPGKRPSSIEAL